MEISTWNGIRCQEKLTVRLWTRDFFLGKINVFLLKKIEGRCPKQTNDKEKPLIEGRVPKRVIFGP